MPHERVRRIPAHLALGCPLGRDCMAHVLVAQYAPLQAKWWARHNGLGHAASGPAPCQK